MSFFEQMLNLQLTLFLLILVGIVLKRKGIISEKGQKTLSDLTVNVILPCNIIESFLSGIETSAEFIKNCGYAVLISIVIQLCCVLAGKYVFFWIPKERKSVFEYGLIVSNSSFIGIPLIDTIHGSIGVLYTSFSQIPVRITMWTSGLALFTAVNKKEAYKKVAKHPCIVSMGIGLILMVSGWKLPIFVDSTLSYLSKCMVPVSMLAIGGMLSESKLKQLFDPQVLYYCVIRLVVCPLLVFVVLKILHIDSVLTSVMVLLTGMPMATTTAILADKYDGDARLASQTIFVSTLLSIITIPLLARL